jgi:probable F420-dependent oxidoreductase
MTTGTDLRLGIGLSWARDAEDLRRLCRMTEEGGIDIVTAADHLGWNAPFALLAAAAVLTTRARLRTYVLDAFFWNPALLAREAATLDRISSGRVELGLGAGHMRHEHEDAGLPFPAHAGRVAETERRVVEVRHRLSAGHRPEPVQSPLPIAVGGWGPGVLGVAARQADIVALGGLEQVQGRPPGTFRLVGSAQTEERVALLAGLVERERPAELGPPVLDALLQRIVLGRPPEHAAAELAAESAAAGGDPSVELLLDSPFVLLAASAEDAATELLRRSERYGITQWCTHTSSAPAMVEVARALRG